ncbi:MAG TPA: fumarylacetoacetate hydrolase family protein [Pelagibacterium sp.]|uniref:fumarylacetoacetate hydrolase family protein n=1 Tax=Pelagibacterium sp. TaxID=1967288 RepID=UPI002BC4B1AD|nr:fumarylacetoacetate hydrolase family protein [Pelagibacterium sp.]HWJ87110.1 fumarylacetoacetate hydrolase family protein [Pelagibacterium sp.]
MPQPALHLAPPPALPIVGRAEVFPVGRIICIGRNYAEHAVEMGHDPTREPPFFFFKSASCLCTDSAVPYPPQTSDLHYEVEMVVALASGGRDIAVDAAEDLIFGYGVGLDLTRRDLQAEAKKLGRPWEMGKAFDCSAPVGPITPVEACGHKRNGTITLSVNDKVRQHGDLDQMIWSVPEMLSVLSHSFALRAGDLIMTGTPSGVGRLDIGDTVSAHVDGLAELHITIVAGD